jgi:hypothetical protein
LEEAFMKRSPASELPAQAALCMCLLTAAGCSIEQGYRAGHAWQQNRCNQIVDQAERDRCISRAGMSYDEYQRQRAK